MSFDPGATLVKLKALRESYAADLPGRLDTLEQWWRERDQEGTLEKAHRHVHSLAGSGATFGFREVSRAARQLELLFKALLATADRQVDATLAAEVTRLFAELRLAAQAPDEWSPEMLAGRPAVSGAREILLLEPDPAIGEELAGQLDNLGYPTRLVDCEPALHSAAAASTPLAAVIDLPLGDGRPIATPGDAAAKEVPLVFISNRDDFAARLHAVRAGGRAYFTKPVDPLALADLLDELTERNPREPYRILVVEDSEALARYYAFILDNAGMTTRVVTDPMTVMEALHDFHPDLVLMDLYMPGCTGLELAAVIRQQQAFVGIPIVFLSGETDGDKQLAAMTRGADDFLNKAISADHLVGSVAARVVRSRSMRSLMVRDSLTGLYNHTRIKEQLGRELARAARHHGELAFAMLDIDHFKSVNDTYGHPTGDRIIKALARYLKQRLRGSDVLGRYGGEEFAVILPETGAAAAAGVMNEIRAGFGRLRHHTDQEEISVTFSCGVAAYPTHLTAKALNDAADKALYRAKREGRNRVVTAEAE